MNWWQRVLLGLLLLAHLALMRRVLALRPDGELHVGAMVGVLLGQGVLASLWLVCLRDSRWWRGLCVLLLAAWAWLVQIMGETVTISESLPIFQVLWRGLQIVLRVLACGGVLSMAWWIFRWEIRSPGDDGSSPRQFSLRRSLVMMAMACIFLAVARNFMPSADQSDGTVFAMLISALPRFLLGTAMYAANCCVMLPMIAAMFRCQERWLRWTMLLLFFGVPVYGIIVAVIEGVFLALLPVHDPDSVWILMVTNMAQLFTIVSTLACLRAIGFRLERVPANHRKLLADHPELTGPATPPPDYYPHGGL